MGFIEALFGPDHPCQVEFKVADKEILTVTASLTPEELRAIGKALIRIAEGKEK